MALRQLDTPRRQQRLPAAHKQQGRRPTASHPPSQPRTPRSVARALPNLITYARAALLLGLPLLAQQHPLAASALYAASAALDAADGAAARALGLTSAFGAFIDVAVDNGGRALLWSLAVANGGAPASLAAFVPLLEGLCLAATHAEHGAGAAWKKDAFGPRRTVPPLLAWLAADGLRAPQGKLLLASLHVLPLLVFLGPEAALRGWTEAPPWRALLAATAALRAAAAALELWVLREHLGRLLALDAAVGNG